MKQTSISDHFRDDTKMVYGCCTCARCLGIHADKVRCAGVGVRELRSYCYDGWRPKEDDESWRDLVPVEMRLSRRK